MIPTTICSKITDHLVFYLFNALRSGGVSVYLKYEKTHPKMQI